MELFDPRWELPNLTPDDLGPFARPAISDEEKQGVWDAYHARTPVRIPAVLGTNDRVALLDARICSVGLSYRQTFSNAKAMLRAQLLHAYVRRRRYHLFCDSPTALPEYWQIGLNFQNVSEAWFFDCPLAFHESQIPDTTPKYLEENRDAVFDIDISRPLEREPFRTYIRMYEELTAYVADKTFLGRPIRVLPAMTGGSDGPLTVAMNLRGHDILMEMIDEPEYTQRLFRFIVDAAILRLKAFRKYYGMPDSMTWFADDSIAMLSTTQYEEAIMPHHLHWYESVGSKYGSRSMHLCGDSSRHFPLIKEKLGVMSFDTGFPVDFTAIRKALGPDVDIQGGPEVATLQNSTPRAVYDRTRAILTSGVKEGGRFQLREGNNLPPNVPWQNLAAMYASVQDFGRME